MSIVNALFDRLDGDRRDKTTEQVHSEIRHATQQQEQQSGGGWRAKLADVLDGNDEERLQQELIKIEAEEKTLDDLERNLDEGRGVGDKLKGMFQKEDTEYEREKERIKEERRRVGLLREDIETKLARERANPEWHEQVLRHVEGHKGEAEDIQRREEALAAQKREAKWHEKLLDKVDGETAEERKIRLDRQALSEKEKDTIRYKVGGVLGTNPPPPNQDSGLTAKLNELAGGGAKGEANEGKLDKAIDLFQQHVMKGGSQSNESAIEQAKDQAIAEGIRRAFNTTTGKP